MDTGIVAVALQCVAMLIAGVWIVASIKGSIRELIVSVRHLSEDIARLQRWLSSVDRRVRRLEQGCDEE